MISPYELLLTADFVYTDQARNAVRYPIRHARQQAWQSPVNQISEQLFDGRYAFLYYYEAWISEPITIYFKVKLPDLHLSYPLLGEQQIEGSRLDVPFDFSLLPGRGCYFYLPCGSYSLQLPIGRHILIGFVVDAGMFRPPAMHSFAFIEHLIQAKKEGSPLPLCAVAFRADPITVQYLLQVFVRLNPNTLDNEQLLLAHLIFLINLSRLHFLAEFGPAQHLAQRAQHALEHLIRHAGAQAHIQEVAQLLGTSPANLSREYRRYWDKRIQDERNRLLLDHIEQVVWRYEKQATAAYEMGFAGPSELNRFIHKMTGLTTGQFKTYVQEKLHL